MTETPTRSERRLLRAASADRRLSDLWAGIRQDDGSLTASGVAVVAVGGYGRRELSPRSDLDVVLLARDGHDVGALTELAKRLWYPLWDAKVSLDHALRTQSELRQAAAEDLRVAFGLLDARHVAGDAAVTMSSRTQLRADWRQGAKRRLPLAAAMTRERWARFGDLASSTTPDLKEAHGGLRDLTAMRALLATWLVDVPSAELDRLTADLLEVRDALHETTGRRSDRLVADFGAEVASRVGLPGVEALRQRVVATGKRIAHLASVSLRDVDWLLTPPRSSGSRRPALEPITANLAVHRGHVVLSERAEPRREPLLALRAAESAASRGLGLADSAAARLGRKCANLPEPWPTQARDLLVSLLGSGPALVDVWATLDQYGVIDAWFPEWDQVRHLAPQSAVHRFTVDRHLVQTCVEVSSSLSEVQRPDLLLMAALLHDIGKGQPGDHSDAGAPIAESVVRRLGWDPGDVAMVRRLVRHHLLLVEVATSQDLESPAVLRRVAAAVEDRDGLDLLAVLTRADAFATGPKAWSPWREQLVTGLTERVRTKLPERVGR